MTMHSAKVHSHTPVVSANGAPGHVHVHWPLGGYAFFSPYEARKIAGLLMSAAADAERAS